MNDNIIILSKICNFEKKNTDMFGCPFYYIYTEVYCEKDTEYFKKRGWRIEQKPSTFWDMFRKKVGS